VCVYRNNEARSCNHCCSGKVISITYFECVFVALGIQHAMRSVILPSVACPALPYCHLCPAPLYHIAICGVPRSTILPSVACPALPYCHLWPAPLYHIAICGLPRSTILPSVPCPTLQYFSTLSYKGQDFREKRSYWTQNVCFDFLYNLSETFLILRRNERDMITNVHISVCLSSCEVP
jgi:hypothetical protein